MPNTELGRHIKVRAEVCKEAVDDLTGFLKKQ